MPNRLASSTSPYLLQHAENPVDWWPWCEEAWEEARRLDRPVLVSIGYSACHWCHVMAHECFEDPDVAAVMNELFVNIKVDREERPDVDAVYMQAVVAMTGRGGWPLTVFCTPQGIPYYGGTYFPKHARMGMPGFLDVLRGAAQAYREHRDAVDRTGEQLRQALTPPRLRADGDMNVEQLDRAADRLVEETDRRWGGFGGAPKFPHPAALDLLLRRFVATGKADYWRAAEVTLDHMARGGIHDQVGGGFHRYSVDAQWIVPHFEKMLYDNAQLARVYLHAHQASGEARWLEVALDTLEHLRRDMLLPEGGFASATDADSEGEEGRFFVWTPRQLRDVLGDEDGALAARLFGVTEAGNFEKGTTVLSLPYPLEHVAASLGVGIDEFRARVASIRERLFQARERRVHPLRDDKVVTSWNALAIAAFAEAGAVLDRPDLLAIALRCADFLTSALVVDGRVQRSWRAGVPSGPGFLEDVAGLADALLTLYEATGDPRWFAEAERLLADAVDRFHDPVAGFYDTAVDGEPLLVRPKTLDDNPLPAGQSLAAHALLRLAALTGEARWREIAETTITPLAEAIARSPLALGNLAWALELAVGEVREVAIVGEPEAADTRALVRAVWERFQPLRVLAWGPPDSVPLLQDRPALDGRATAYVCRGFACSAPTTDPAELASQVGGARGPTAATPA